MIDDRELFERAVGRFAPPERSFERLVTRRDRKHRNKRIAAGVVALVVAAAGIGALLRAFPSGTMPADDPRSTFVGAWTSTELDDPGRSQTMTILPAEDGALDIVLHDDSSWLCSDRQTRVDGADTPSTMTGTGRLVDAATLVVPSPVLACVDGREPGVSGFPEEGRTSYTLVLDLATDRLFDNLGVAWHRGSTPANGANTTTECENEPQTGSPGTCSMLGGEVTFHADRPWGDHAESYLDPRIFWLIGRSDEGGIVILANPKAEASCDTLLDVPASAEELVRAIRSNPDLETTAPVAERVGGVDALRLDVAAVPGASTCVAGNVPVLSVYNREPAWGTLGAGTRGRLYVLEPPGGYARALVIDDRPPRKRPSSGWFRRQRPSWSPSSSTRGDGGDPRPAGSHRRRSRDIGGAARSGST